MYDGDGDVLTIIMTKELGWIVIQPLYVAMSPEKGEVVVLTDVPLTVYTLSPHRNAASA